MEMQKLMRIREMACEQLENIQREDFQRPANVANTKELMSILEKTYKVEEAMQGGGYSQGMHAMRGGEWIAEGRYGHEDGGAYDSGNSYRRGGRHYVVGHYSRDGGGSYDGGSYGNYSRDGGYNGSGR